MKTIAIILFENFSNHCLANAVEPFRAANTISRKILYSWHFLSVTGGTVTSSSGLPVETRKWAHNSPGGDYLFVMPSYGFEHFANLATGRILRAARRRFSMIVGFDTGAWLLASAGLLHQREATIHWDEFTRFSEAFPNTKVVDDRYVLTQDLATCGGAATAIELTLKLIERDHTAMFALEVAALFMHGERSPPPDPFERVTTSRIVRQATAAMRRRIETPLRIPDLAAQLNIPQRALEAAFQQELGHSPRSAYKVIRLREARRMVERTQLKMTEVAQRCGYRDAAAFTRAYKAEFDATPRDHRRAG